MPYALSRASAWMTRSLCMHKRTFRSFHCRKPLESLSDVCLLSRIAAVSVSWPHTDPGINNTIYKDYLVNEMPTIPNKACFAREFVRFIFHDACSQDASVRTDISVF